MRIASRMRMPEIQDAVGRLTAAFLEDPGIRLSLDQATRLCGLERATYQLVIETLVSAQFLRRSSHDTFVRASTARL